MIVDASAILALLFDEPGGDALLDLPSFQVSAVNWSEVLQKAGGQDVEGPLLDLGAEVVDFDHVQARIAADLFPATKTFGLSLADRACLALAQASGAPVLTADKAWQGVEGIDVRLIR